MNRATALAFVLLLLTGCAHRNVLLHCRVDPGEVCYYEAASRSLVCSSGTTWIWRSCK